jgi:hypothetical protein
VYKWYIQFPAWQGDEVQDMMAITRSKAAVKDTSLTVLILTRAMGKRWGWPCSFGLSATSQQYFSLRTNQPPVTSQQYFSLRTNQHQPSATSRRNRLLSCFCENQCTTLLSTVSVLASRCLYRSTTYLLYIHRSHIHSWI